MRNIILILFSIILNIKAFSQSKEGAFWFYGVKAGINFNNSVPFPDQNGQTSSGVYAGTISDDNGNLLFYLDGDTVYNRLHLPMPNGVFSGFSSVGVSTNIGTDKILISKIPNNSNKYCVFYINRNFAPNLTQKYSLEYFIIDMTLDNGKGDVVPNSQSIIIPATVNSGCAPIISLANHMNGKDFWLITAPLPGSSFRTYLVDSNGVNFNSFTNSIGTLPSLGNGTSGGVGNPLDIRISPNSQLLAFVGLPFNSNASPFSYLYSFNKSTGQVSNRKEILCPNAFNNPINFVSFSPNSANLFLAHQYEVYQYSQLSSPVSIINASRQLIKQNSVVSQLHFVGFQIALNGKIYFTYGTPLFGSHIGVINCPNSIGFACQYQDTVLSVFPGLSGLLFPVLNQTLFVNANILQAQADKDTICLGDSINLSAFGAGADAFQWVKISGPGPSGS